MIRHHRPGQQLVALGIEAEQDGLHPIGHLRLPQDAAAASCIEPLIQEPAPLCTLMLLWQVCHLRGQPAQYGLW